MTQMKAVETVLAELNIRLFESIHMAAGKQPFRDRIAIFFSEGGPYILALAFIAVWFRSDDNKRMILLEATEASFGGLLLNQLIALFYFHPRPCMVGLCAPLIPHAPEASFPSDHATLLFAAAIYLLALSRWYWQGSFLFLVACLTSWGRVYSSLHFPLDMIGILAAGSVSALLT